MLTIHHRHIFSHLLSLPMVLYHIVLSSIFQLLKRLGHRIKTWCFKILVCVSSDHYTVDCADRDLQSRSLSFGYLLDT